MFLLTFVAATVAMRLLQADGEGVKAADVGPRQIAPSLLPLPPVVMRRLSDEVGSGLAKSQVGQNLPHPEVVTYPQLDVALLEMHPPRARVLLRRPRPPAMANTGPVCSREVVSKCVMHSTTAMFRLMEMTSICCA
jgi:hypothetical protein